MRGKLSTYRAKRDFTKTAEPSGSAIRKAEYPRFVIQKHDATRLHYDLRLELDGVFKSWAVTKGPSLDPADKRLAVEVEDHPLDYGDFEGTIPKGQYGGGTVMLWDRGFWVPEDGKSAEQSLRDGELKFLLAGEKLQGGWVLVRMKGDRFGGTRNNWLLIKHKDEGAHPGDKDKLLDNDRSVASGRIMEEIAAGKGRGPTPFMLARRKVKPNAIWNSNKSDGGAESALSSTPKTRAKSSARKRSSAAKSGGSKGSSITEGNLVLGVKISNPDKELWPVSGDSAAVTKIELARYIAEVGPWMIEHVKGRPCSVIRAPDGIEGQQFFQRHAGPGTPDTVEQVRVSGDRKPYIQIDTVEGLVAMAQMAALEFHPWNSAPGNASLPGRLVFDLDPGPDVPFSATVRAAKELRSRLGDLGLVPFCKTTGGKGLHVVTPIKTGRADAVDWDQAKMFAQTVCAQMAHDSPSLYVIKMTKTLRTGRIFLDYLRNDSTATAVAPLSPRARPGAPVSMPLTWAQVREDLDPKRFTTRSVPALLARTSAWKDYSSSARSLKAAIKRLVGDG
jgi:bifunctional non-homologous end joining protein LigD